MKLPGLLFSLLMVIMLSCSQTDKKQISDPQLTPLAVAGEDQLSIMKLDERLSEADSLVFVFYKDPHGKDSLRYTRFYRQYASVDSMLIKFVKDNLLQPTTRFERIKKCRSEGKVWCFRNGEIFQTIYFSSFSNECSFLYIIKNGQFYYSSISEAMSMNLKTLEAKASTPTGEGG